MLTPIALLVASALSLPAPIAAPPRVLVDPTSPRMLTALETVKADEIKSDVYFIASDQMGGRDTPSDGLRVTARFLRSRLERLGWKPGAKDGYFYEYPLEQRVIDENASRIDWEGKGASGQLRFGTDYFLSTLFDVSDLSVSGPVVFAGEGSKEDLGSARVEGKWALVFDAGTEVRELSRNARRAKAKGLIVAPGPNYKGDDYPKRFAPALERQRKGSVAWPSKPGAKADEEDRGPRDLFPMVLMTRSAAESLLEVAKKPATPAKGADLGITLTETRKLVGDGGKIAVENVCGFWPGSDPVLAKECVILSAHYDHIGIIKGEVHNGADDNGSGTSTMLAVAEALQEFGPLKRSVMIIWVSGEEKGLWGSKAFSENPWFPEGVKPVADINIDMVGRNAPDKLLVTPTREKTKEYNDLVKMAEKLAPLEGFPKLGSADQYYERSDHYMFAKLGIPVMFLFSDVHEDYHRAGDDPEKLDYDKVHRVARLVLRILDGLDEQASLK
ncbi:MAG: M28 family metallopeptidase [Planctomycetota bacterium]|nr:M28 family metallopeptidase [Planctomycetota bacterium]